MKKKDKKDEKYNSEITPQEKEMLNQENVHNDGDDDAHLINRERDADFSGNDLDIPEPEEIPHRQKKKIPDEENHLYSQGGNTNDLEQDKSADRDS